MKKRMPRVISALLAFSLAVGTAHAQYDAHAQASEEKFAAWVDTDSATDSPEDIETIALDPTSPVEVADSTAGIRRANILTEEIVVTAQKREENRQDVPISIAAFSAEQLSVVGADKPADLAKITPGLVFTEFAGYTLIYIRGVGTDNFVPSAEPSIAIYLDDVYTPLGQGFGSNFGAVKRVEVLKGPQGTLFGRNSTGGAISITTKSPDSEPETNVEVAFGNYSSMKAKAYMSVPVGDYFALGVSGVYNKNDSYYTALPPNRGFPEEITEGFRIKARWYPTDNFETTLTALRLEQTLTGSSISTNARPSPAFFFIPPQPDDYTTEGDASQYSASFQTLLAMNSLLTLPGLDIKLILSDQDVSTSFVQYDFDGSRLPLVSFFVTDEYVRTKTAEIQFISNQDTWGADWLQFVGGIYYLDGEGGFNPVNLQVAGTIVDQLPDVTGSLAEFLNSSLGLQLQLPQTNNFRVSIFGLLGTKSLSAFVQSTATLTDKFDITIGGRVQREKRSLLESRDATANSDGSYTTVLEWPAESTTVNNFSPKIALSYRLADEVMAYASFTKGFKSQTYNIINIYQPPQYLPPEEVTSYEAGFKSDLFDGVLRLNGAVFQSEIQNLQTGFVSLLSGGAVNFQTAGEARIRGAEAEVVLVPMPESNPGLVLTANGSYLDAIYTDYRGGNGYAPGTGVFSDTLDFTGNQIVRTPKWSGTVGANQTLDVPGGHIDLNLSLYMSDLYWFSAQNAPGTEQPKYSLLSGQVGYTYEPWQLEFSVFGTNLTDEKYFGTINETDFGIQHFLAAPLQYGARISWTF